MKGSEQLYAILSDLDISFEYYEHPPVVTIEEMDEFSKAWKSTRCKNIFLRNHKGNRHYLVISRHDYAVSIHELEQRLKQGKLSFASPWRLEKYLGLSRGAVSPFGLVNDNENHVHVFIDEGLKAADTVTFHPNTNSATLKISFNDFLKFMDHSGNSYEFVEI